MDLEGLPSALSLLLADGNRLIRDVSTAFVRDQINLLSHNRRLQIVRGARGVGKTTLLLQFAKLHWPIDRSIYLSVDDLYFASASMLDTVRQLYDHGYRHFILDEVHRYGGSWSQELKNLIDRLPDLMLVATGSSALQILATGRGDLSRRTGILNLEGLSFADYLTFRFGIDKYALSLEDVLKTHVEISNSISELFPQVLSYFSEYLRHGYYPFFEQDEVAYFSDLRGTVGAVLETDIPEFATLRYTTLKRLRQLLNVISKSAPFKPNISKLSTSLELNRQLLMELLDLLDDARLIRKLFKKSSGDQAIGKMAKIYLHNSNLCYALQGNPNVGTLRETVFLSALAQRHEIFAPADNRGDFQIEEYRFEIGGRNKSFDQIKDIRNSYVIADDILVGFNNRIPLWVIALITPSGLSDALRL